MTHIQDFQVKLYQYGSKPANFRWTYCTVRSIFGFFSRLLGTKPILKTAIWVGTKAIHHYDKLLDAIDRDEDTRTVIKKNQSDEYGHIKQSQKLLSSQRNDKTKHVAIASIAFCMYLRLISESLLIL